MELFSFLENIDTIQAILLVAGLIFVIIEMFHPGFGAPGLLGIALLIAGILMTASSLFEVLVMVIILLAILGVALTFVLHSATKGRLSKTLILTDSLKKETGFSGTEDLEYFVGKEGKSITVLRPSGTAEFEGVKLDVVTDGGFIDKDTRIKIVQVSGRRIVVRSLE